jgi:hypothetical protein
LIGFRDYNCTQRVRPGEEAKGLAYTEPLSSSCGKSSLRTHATQSARHSIETAYGAWLTLSEAGLSTGGLAEDGRARAAEDDGLGVREDGGDVEAS